MINFTSKEVPEKDGWYWIQYHKNVSCPCKVMHIGKVISIETFKQDSFRIDLDLGSEVRYDGMPDDSVRFGPEIHEPLMTEEERNEWIQMLKRGYTKDNYDELFRVFILVNDGIRQADKTILEWRKEAGDWRKKFHELEEQINKLKGQDFVVLREMSDDF